ncbi:hypothetical protein K505DRAFT_308160 [Melanomma pulvis-pyrius CBS 109.77]|uniref:F-box domain-containing protein n=1 Tax=Melanomma pulvis-pyrius CBS 109.77 TaxID=1314802 RepID=A0A6A6X798_9PLEO|nr:hypothetical protein K505DRAFT_308160 [Melanomma pulvis-pyrius CBS 109.77]
MKRARDKDDLGEQPSKIRRIPVEDRLSKLSDELIVRILSFGSVRTLLLCQRVSKRLGRIAVDSELWKAAFYNQFVLPRASRIPGIKDAAASDHLCYSSKLSKWLDDGYLVKNGLETNWKQQYRLRHNWSQGQCAVSEILVAERPPDPPLLVMMQNGLIFTADSISGLRVWSSKNERELIASTSLITDRTDHPQSPTSMAINSQEGADGHHRVVIGFEDGSFSVYALKRNDNEFIILFDHAPSNNGMLSALAYASPYLLTMTEDQLLSIYAFPENGQFDSTLEAPRLLYSMRSHTIWPPVSLSIRTTSTSMTAAIAYSIPTYLSGWTVGIQEMRLTHEGDLIESRLATAADENFHTLSGHYSGSSPSTRLSSPFFGRPRGSGLPSTPGNSKPTSMSYSHPYLLVAHPDNTLSSYLVKSTSSVLQIGSGARLWGHTSSVSGAYVGVRGKAVSVSRLGDELRVWDLEGGTALSARKRAKNGELSVRVQTTKTTGDLSNLFHTEPQRKFGLRLALDQGFDDSTVSRGWVGFDEQHVIVLREKSQGSQALFLYDFT